ncbi:fork head domain-containing protein [Lipomyces arxii]|uniref:fork head domain-containing protein n=1 Tax=Lipomyces arxii TaxID=56418 RepID=UPI0034CD2400
MMSSPGGYSPALSDLQVQSGLEDLHVVSRIPDAVTHDGADNNNTNSGSGLATIDENHTANNFLFTTSGPSPVTPAQKLMSEREMLRSGSISGHGFSTPDTLPPSEAFAPHPDVMQCDLLGGVKMPDSDMMDMVNSDGHSQLQDSSQQGDTHISESRISAYARLDFASFTFYVQTLQVVMGRHVENHQGQRHGPNPGDRTSLGRAPSKGADIETANKPTPVGVNGAIDVHLGTAKAISRRHAKIFYNFANQRFEFSVLGRNGAFVDDVFVEKGATVQLNHGSRVQIGQIGFTFLLPSSSNLDGGDSNESQTIRPADAISFRDANTFSQLPVVSQEDEIKHEDQPSLQEANAEVTNYNNFFSEIAPEEIELDQQQDIDLQVQTEEQQRHDEELRQAEFNVLHALTGSRLDVESHINQDGKVISDSSLDPLLSRDGTPQEQQSRNKILKRAEKRHPTPPSPSSIPEEYRVKPPNSYSSLIEISLQTFATERGMSLSDIYQAIQELFPYYRFAPYGWQNSVRHNLSLNKLFVKIAKEGKGWLWGLDEQLFLEKEAKKNRPLARERREQERREKKERERKEKEERERRAKEEKERLELERKKKELAEKQRKELELAERKKAVLALAQSASEKAGGAIPSLTSQTVGRVAAALEHRPPALKARTATGAAIAKPQTPKPPINKDTLKALQLLQQTISAQLQNNNGTSKAVSEAAISGTPGTPTPTASNSAAVAAAAALRRSATPVIPAVGASNKAGTPGAAARPNAKAAALAKALVMTLAHSMAKPGATNGSSSTTVPGK